ncbi:hypothetical protein GCM10023173_12780 [Sphingobacterium thermophilum]|uniref:Uncharacterized protein n=1 Tax=Sphingobacterium thermophilum TaxID=768534 RepID=A0ABP8R0Y7_9SPHI
MRYSIGVINEISAISLAANLQKIDVLRSIKLTAAANSFVLVQAKKAIPEGMARTNSVSTLGNLV